MNEAVIVDEEPVARAYERRPMPLLPGEHGCNVLYHYHTHAAPAWVCRWLYARFMDLLDAIP